MRIQTDTKATHKAIPTILELSIAEEPQVVLKRSVSAANVLFIFASLFSFFFT